MAGRTEAKSLDYILTADNVAMGAVFAAATFVGTVAIPIPVGIGFLNFGEVIIYTAAFLFGPIVGGLAGVGASFADIALGYSVFAPVTLIVKSIEGAIVGHVSGESRLSKVIAVAAGAPVMIVGYFLTVSYLQGVPIAAATELPIDIMQAVVGLAVALPLAEAIKSRVPRISAGRESTTKGRERQLVLSFLFMGFLSILLFWLPVIGPVFAGVVGGRKADDLPDGVIASIIPSFIAGGTLFFVVDTFGIPVVGDLIGGFLTIVAILSSLSLIAGAAIGSSISHQTT